MKKRLIFLFASPLILIGLIFSYYQLFFTSIESNDNDLSTMIHSFNYSESENEIIDFSFLDQIVLNKKIILLGEQQHGDGSSIKLKSDIVKYLHEKHNFKVIVFEANMLDCNFLWDSISQGKGCSELYNKNLYSFWANSRQMGGLINYINKCATTSNQLLIKGCDIRIKNNYFPLIISKLKCILSDNIDILDKFDKITQKLFLNDHYIEEYKLDIKTKTDFVSLSNHLSTILKEKLSDSSSTEIIEISKYLEYISEYYKIRFLTINDNSNNNLDKVVRDSIMAEIINWIKSAEFRNEKIIIWSANSHIIKNSKTIETNDISVKYKRMGQHLFEQWGDCIYSLCITSYQGKTLNIYNNNIEKINESIIGSIEESIHKLDIKFGFINLSDHNNKIFSKKKYTKILGHSNMMININESTDGILYIDKMEPVIYKRHE